MATRQEIISDPRFEALTPEKKQKILSMASDGPSSTVDYGKVVKDIFQKPASYIKDLATNPVTMAEALPMATGAIGAASPYPMGATAMTYLGQKAQEPVLNLLGRPDRIPSDAQNKLELALTSVGDIGPLASIKKSIGSQAIGQAERVLGKVSKTPPPGNIRTSVVLTNRINDMITNGELTPGAAKSLKPAIDTIFDKEWLRGTQYEPDLVKAKQGIQKVLNTLPGRSEAASYFSGSQAIPNAVRNVSRILPKQYRQAAARYGIGGLAAALGYKAGSELLGENK